MSELLTILIGALPISEVRGAIPLAMGVFGFPALKAYLLGVIGNLIPVVPLLFLLHYVSGWLMKRFYFLNRFFNWLFSYTRYRHANHFEIERHHFHLSRDNLLSIALFIFVAIPLPLTGAWSGVVAAFVFGIPFWRSVIAISAGIAVSGLIVLLLSLGLINI